MAEKNIFEGVDEPKQVRRLKSAGIHRKVTYVGVEYMPAETKKGENGKPDTELSARAVFSFTVPHEIKEPGGKILISQDLVFEEMRFCPATREEDVKFLNDKYNKNVVVGKNTAKEQMKIDWEQMGMFLFQLGTAISRGQFATVKTKLMKYARGYAEESFKGLIEGFEKEFPAEKFGNNLIDLKTVWNNSKEKRTSFLRIAKASSNNIVFAPHEPNAVESTLFINEYEKKNMKAQYTGIDNPPASKEEIIDEEPKAGGLTAGAIKDEDDLLEGTGIEDNTDLF
jgi:hypothetical protein